MRAAVFPVSPLHLAPAKSGRFAIEHDTYPPGHVFNLVSSREALLTGKPAQSVCAGKPMTIHRLVEAGKGGCLMSDVPIELRQMKEFAGGARGNVLIGGLGLGVITRMVAARPSVKSVTVVEIEPDVINLCGDGLPPNVRVVQMDLFEYVKTCRWGFDTAFLDTWSGTNEMTWTETVAPLRRIIRNRFGKRTVKCWAEDQMIGQMIRSLSHASGQPLDAFTWSAAHFAFRAATIWKYPAVDTPESMRAKAFLKTVLEREQMAEKDQLFRHLLSVFLTQVGSHVWEQLFGKYWDEGAARKKATA